MNLKIIDLSGKTFGRLNVLGLGLRGSEASVSDKEWRWRCQCSCGNLTEVRGMCLRNGITSSCGCLRKEKISKLATTHGLSGMPEYKVFRGIHSRCYNKNVKCYKNYGGRGIRMSVEWKNDFAQFMKDMGPRPSTSHSIDREDVNGDYSSANCKWSTTEEQGKNKRVHALAKEVELLKLENERLISEISMLMLSNVKAA